MICKRLSFVFFGVAAAGAVAVAAVAQHARPGRWPIHEAVFGQMEKLHGDGQTLCEAIARLHQSHFEQLAALHEQLNLSQEQRETLHETLKSHHGDMAAAARPVVVSAHALCDAVLAENADETAIRAAAGALGKSIGDAAVVLAGIKAELHRKAGLTPEQMRKIADFKAAHDAMLDAFLNSLPTKPETPN